MRGMLSRLLLLSPVAALMGVVASIPVRWSLGWPFWPLRWNHLRDEWMYLQVTLLVAIPLLYLPAFRVCDRQSSRPRFYILLIVLTSSVSLVQAAAVNAYVNGHILSDATIMV